MSVRRVLDEVVELAEGYYLGKVYLKWWWGRWGLIGYFALTVMGASDGVTRLLSTG